MTLTISSDFDSGNIQVLDSSDPAHIKLAIRPDTQSAHFQWFHFKVDGLNVGQTYGLSLSNASESTFNSAWTGYNAVASYDHKHWFRVPSGFDGKALNFSLAAEQAQVWFAYFEPYSRERHDGLIEQAQTNAGMQVLATGKSIEGRDIQLLRKGDGSEGKRKIWFIAQQHPGEHMAEWFMEGVIERLQQKDDTVLRQLLASADLYLVPNMNPDGAFHGHLRTNAAGKDLNRAWQDSTEAQSPEVLFVRQQMEKYGVDMFLDVHGDEEIPHVFTAACEGNPGYTIHQRQLKERFRSRLSDVTVDFQTVYGYPRSAPGQANMNLAANAIGERYKCLALTLEMPFKDHDNAPDPLTGWSGKRSAQLAKDVLSVLAQMVEELR
ncbi:M14-type cytosolic carboxypeptidase [Pseudomonas syringae group genomosp. 3]|uniref:M14 family metallopeptidase n=1 Tax=Pseudomonas syringae group genomosp. 3 TaxID=251701 RepID=UPI0006E6DE85|nr:M14-type cytosolic carboxypeptidase [Pseudomonas syringae group genomosp. 3]KPW46169.1 Peptidase M14, carboxypeptidase A [Pseudomonas syringae pv. berberidis]KPY16222.1 Peptidase M14, carboxypeptidase A [Pseudomonas syringae pv. philadelphi]RMM27762.1 Peptidase M14, carboxypeptidase A [Pseudomonas syringae pv. berberidis]RMP60896.1 Peptidase M14, carboxypeptidase A [Pseudomonas syringae pv. berberidis]RMQ36904.1 Peptidase M14, carboxypeptidase A [Pseudomonas syringae pv. berberidis]